MASVNTTPWSRCSRSECARARPPTPLLTASGACSRSIKADQQLAKFWFLNKLPSELRTRKAIQIFEKEGTFEDLKEECHEAYLQALSDRSSKRSMAAVNSVQDDDEEAEQEEDEPTTVNLVNGGESQQWKGARGQT